MPINFPDNPTDNQEFNGYIYDATRGVWDVKLISDPLGSINITNPTAGEALVFDGSGWVNQGVATPASVKTISSDSIAVDFSDGIPLEKRAVAGNITVTGSNYTAGITKQILLQGDTVARTTTFPAGWNFLDDPITKIGANKTNVLTINCFGTTEDSVFVSKSGPNAFKPIQATGGSESEILVGNITFKVHVFTATDNFYVQSLGDSGSVEYLVVGGGGGAGPNLYHSGGGGAGGMLFGNSSVSAGNTYSVVVGAGGGSGGSNRGANGGDSSFNSVVAFGGGGGGSYYNRNGLAGGSGGGAGGESGQSGTGGSGVSGQGFRGGNTNTNNSGGGGGAGQQGQDATVAGTNGNGGNGLQYSITGTTLYYAGGGGASGYQGPNPVGGLGGGGNGSDSNGQSGQANTGGGGGAGERGGTITGSGGSGIVVIRYPITDGT